GGDDELMPILEEALSVPVFAPAEAQLALARGAALASAQNVDITFTDHSHNHSHNYGERRPVAQRRRQLGQTGPLALLVAGVLTFTVSASIAVSLQLAPKKDSATSTSEPRPAAKISPETPAAVTHLQAPVALPSPVVEAVPPPPPEAPPVEAAPPPVYSEAPVSIPEGPAAVTDAPPVEGTPPAVAAAPLPPEGAPLPPEQLAPPVAPQPAERPGIMSRIRDRIRGGREDEVQPAPELAPPPPAPPAEPAPPTTEVPPVLPPA
ncbi:MAG TPA: hypothetical protein VHJ79_02890, partial [Mycobacterium sp.]|nr:hypothetical protein [Mycobacterium sp.]